MFTCSDPRVIGLQNRLGQKSIGLVSWLKLIKFGHVLGFTVRFNNFRHRQHKGRKWAELTLDLRKLA